MTMKKIFFYDFMPSKAEEEVCKANSTLYEVSRSCTLIEGPGRYLPPAIDPQNPWQIKITLTQYEVGSCSFIIPSVDALDHIFSHWNLEEANRVVKGGKVHVNVWDVTEQTTPKMYRGSDVCLKILPSDDNYLLACMEVFHDRRLKVHDVIGLYWDTRASVFRFKLF